MKNKINKTNQVTNWQKVLRGRDKPLSGLDALQFAKDAVSEMGKGLAYTAVTTICTLGVAYGLSQMTKIPQAPEWRTIYEKNAQAIEHRHPTGRVIAQYIDEHADGTFETKVVYGARGVVSRSETSSLDQEVARLHN